jgi:hypothetical protein
MNTKPGITKRYPLTLIQMLLIAYPYLGCLQLKLKYLLCSNVRSTFYKVQIGMIMMRHRGGIENQLNQKPKCEIKKKVLQSDLRSLLFNFDFRHSRH